MPDHYPATVLCDFYKVSHKAQYPKGTEFVYSTWIPRESRIEGINKVVAFGFQAFITRYLIDYFWENFFSVPEKVVVEEYERVIQYTLGQKPDSTHIRELHQLGYLPIEIKAVPEGTLVPLRVPMLTIENTDPRFFWLTNYLETLFSTECWMPATSATIAHKYRTILDDAADRTGGDKGFVPFQGHDFSMRGMASLEAAAASGAGHLLSFTGTDTIPAILYAEEYYGANIETELIGTSIPATEHSVMSSYGRDELASYRHLITEVYPTGFVSIVSDTWDFWNVLTSVIFNLKDEIIARDGRVVVRPDSGDPVRIVSGDKDAPFGTCENKGAVEVLWDIFGGTINEKGFKVLDPHIGLIYGDSITLERAKRISLNLEEKGFASTNVVYGIGSYTYQYVTRDTFGFALKATQVTIDGEEINIFKDPATDVKKMKKSLTGRVVVIPNPADDDLISVDGLSRFNETEFSDNLLRTIFKDGELIVEEDFATVRNRLAGTVATTA